MPPRASPRPVPRKPYPCHGTPPAAHRRAGATRSEDYADPECFKYPIHGKTKAETKALVRNSSSRFAQSGDLYPPKKQAEVWATIDRARQENHIGPYRSPPESPAMTKKNKSKNPAPNPRRAKEKRTATGQFKKTAKAAPKAKKAPKRKGPGAAAKKARHEASVAKSEAKKAKQEAVVAKKDAAEAVRDAKDEAAAAKRVAAAAKRAEAAAKRVKAPRKAKKGKGKRPVRRPGESTESFESRCSTAAKELRACGAVKRGEKQTMAKKSPRKGKRKAKRRNPTPTGVSAATAPKPNPRRGKRKAKRRNPTPTGTAAAAPRPNPHHKRKGKRKAKRNPTENPRRHGKAWHAHMRNPMSTGYGDAAIFAVTVAIFYSGAEITDRILATRAANSVGTTTPAYGADAFARILVKPSGIRLAVPAGVAVVGLGAAMALGRKHPLAGSLLAGIGGGSLIFLAKVGIVDYAMPALMSTGNGSSSDQTWGNRLYPEFQTNSQTALSALVTNEATIGALSSNFPYILGDTGTMSAVPAVPAVGGTGLPGSTPIAGSSVCANGSAPSAATGLCGLPAQAGVGALPAREPIAQLPPGRVGVGHAGCGGSCGGTCSSCSASSPDFGWPPGAIAYSAAEDEFYNAQELPMGIGKHGRKGLAGPPVQQPPAVPGFWQALAQNGFVPASSVPNLPGLAPLCDQNDPSRVIGMVAQATAAQRTDTGLAATPPAVAPVPPFAPVALPALDNVRYFPHFEGGGGAGRPDVPNFHARMS
jgi:hypothetical protein